MTFSEMKLQVTNAVRAYFSRNWITEDLMNSGQISEPAYTILKTFLVVQVTKKATFRNYSSFVLDYAVYVTLFYAMLSFTFGSYLHLIWDAGPCKFTLSLLYITIERACTSGASFSLFTKYLFKIHQVLIARLFEGSTLGIGIVWLDSSLTRERRVLYTGCLSLSCFLIVYNFFGNALGILDSNTPHWALKAYIVQALVMGYLVIYSQEILYDARFGEVNFVNRTLAAFFHLPALVVHVARLLPDCRN